MHMVLLILLRNNFQYKVTNFVSDSDGNYICVDLELTTITLRLINICAPNVDTSNYR